MIAAGLACVAALGLTACAHARLDAAESRYADFLDAAGAIDTIDSGIVHTVDGRDRAHWARQYDAAAAALAGMLGRIAAGDDAGSRRSLAAMQAGLAYRQARADTHEATCADAPRADLSPDQLSGALYACFSSIGDSIAFEGETHARISVLQQLEHAAPAARRRALFLALSPLWRAVNGDNSASSPYRRLVAARAPRMQATILNAEAALGIPRGAGEAWLIAALEAWRAASPGDPIEPWDFRHSYAQGARAVEACAPVEAVRDANARFFSDLGAPIDALNVIQDVGRRPGMSPVDFADFTTTGRMVEGAWRPATIRVSVVLDSGGLGASAELAHEFGHVAHFAAMRARPSLLLPDDLTTVVEAIADVTAWSVYEPSWQARYLGCASAAADGRRARLGPVMLDIAWGLFEMRMADDPSRDPNRVWTEITEAHLNIVPHPELSWWAVRGQLVDEPGYMTNYAFGAFVTADLRQRIRSRIGAFDAGNAQWYAETSAGLFHHGGTLAPADLLGGYLGRPVRPDALLDDIRALQAP